MFDLSRYFLCISNVFQLDLSVLFLISIKFNHIVFISFDYIKDVLERKGLLSSVECSTI